MSNTHVAPFRGLTWDHPRGTHALRAAGTAWGTPGKAPLIEWDAQPLEGFESASIEELAAQYDLIVLDHPHLGDAIASRSLQPLDDVLTVSALGDATAHAVGPSAASYVAEGRTWALPLDAATQVAAVRSDLVEGVPRTWGDVVELSGVAPVALSLAGPHAFLTLCSLATALGHAPRSLPPIPSRTDLTDHAALLFDRATALNSFAILHDLATRVPQGTAELNPIGLLERMRATNDIAYIPLVYGYVNYASGSPSDTQSPEPAISFADAPAADAGGVPGSTIGGTGIAVSRRTKVTPALVEHLEQLLSADAQEQFVPAHDGQPSRDSAWESDGVNEVSGDFYRNTRRTIDASWVRPRFPRYTSFQSEASAIVRAAVTGTEPTGRFDAENTIDRIETAYRHALDAAASLLTDGARL